MMSNSCSSVAKCWQQNLQHSRSAVAHLVQQLSAEKSPVIALVQEPHLSGKSRMVGFPGHLGVFAGGKSPRAAIISKDHHTLFCPLFSGRDIATVLTTVDGEDTYVASVYLDCTKLELPAELLALCSQRSDKRLLIGLDSNAHSALWGCINTDARGEMVEEFLFSNGLVIINRGCHDTFVSTRASSIIDITVATAEVFVSLSNWHVNQVFQFSDHRRIEFDLGQIQRDSRTTWGVRRANWQNFKHHCGLRAALWKVPYFWTPKNIDYQVSKFTRDINRSLSRSCPRITPGQTKGRKPVPWWTPELSDLRKKTRRAEKHARKGFGSPEAFKLLRKEFSRGVRRARRESWKTFSSNPDDIIDMAKFSRSVFRGKANSVGLLKGADGETALGPDETLDILLDNFFKNSKPNRGEHQPVGSKLLHHQISTKVFTVEKVRIAIKSFGKFKSEGPDGWKPIVLQNLDEGSLTRLTFIFQACYCLGYVPRLWRASKAIFIPKSGKKDYSEARSFRPISLSNFTQKVMERVVCWELEDGPLKDNPLSPNQHAFRKGHSTDTALGMVTNFIESNILRDKYVLGVFLDIEGAFDNLSIRGVVESMKTRGFPKEMINWYTYYLKNRTVTVELARATKTRHLTRGTPQGGVLSPLAWNVNFEGLLDILKDKPAIGVGYADDGMVMVSGIDPDTLISIMQPYLNRASAWGVENGLNFSASKTIAVMFTKKRWQTSATLKMSGKEIDFSPSAKYLGVTLNSKLTWNDHIVEKIKKGKSKLMQLRGAVGILWGPKPELMLWAYNGIVIPALTHGSMIWGNRPLKTHVGRLQKLNRLAALGVGPMRSKTPTAGLEVILHLCPLDLLIQKVGCAAYLRCKDKIKSTWDGLGKRSKGFQKTWENFLVNEGVAVVEEDNCQQIYNWERPFHWLSSDEGKPAIICTLNISHTADRCYSSESSIFVEGQVVESIGIKSAGKNAALATLQLLSLCCSWMISSDIDLGSSVLRFVVKHLPASLGSPMVTSSATKNCLNWLVKLGKHLKFKPAFITPEVFQKYRPIDYMTIRTQKRDRNFTFWPTPAPKGSNKISLNHWCETKWSEFWQSRPDCRQTKLWFGNPDLVKSKLILQMNRKEIGLFIQFITGHGWLNRHVALLNQEWDVETKLERGLCRLCLEDEETPVHLVCHCPALVTERLEVFGIGRYTDYPPPAWSPEQLLRFLRVPHIDELFGDQV